MPKDAGSLATIEKNGIGSERVKLDFTTTIEHQQGRLAE